jgi:hypothetical protein
VVRRFERLISPAEPLLSPWTRQAVESMIIRVISRVRDQSCCR